VKNTYIEVLVNYFGAGEMGLDNADG